jgi:3-methyladenine DNA glycosylase AlkD
VSAPAIAVAAGSRPSPATERARALVAARTPAAVALGRAAGERLDDPAAAARTLRAGLEGLADPEYLDGQRRIAPGIGPILGVRGPLLGSVTRGLRSATRRDRADALLDGATAMLRGDALELHWLAFDLLGRAIASEPERTWQLVRAEAARASDWITVDSLAHVAGRGILAEPYRWAELEQLVYSPSRWERRLVGSTIATIPFVNRSTGRQPEIAGRGLAILGDLMGDADPEVQKALSWALRSLTIVDAEATTAFLRSEATTTRATGDGHRAWVVRDALEKLSPATADELRAAVAGVRKRPGARSTSRAAAASAAFAGLGVAVPPAERAVLDRT